MTDVSTALSTTPSWPADSASSDEQTSGAPNSSPTLETAADVLDRLVAVGWHMLSNRLSPGSLIVIDHVAVGPGGIFVIDSHSFARSAVGVSVISDPDQPAKISAAQAVADAVRSLLPPLTRQYVVSVLAYSDTSPMSLSRGPIQICTTAMLEHVIAARHDVLSGSEIADIIASLDVALQPAGDGPRPAPLAQTPQTVGVDPSAAAPSDGASTRRAETRRGRRFLGRRGDKAAAAEAAKLEIVAPPVSAYPPPIEPSPYPFVSPPVAAIEPEVIEAEPEVIEPEVIEPPTDFIEAEPEVIEPEFIEAEPEVIEPQTDFLDVQPEVIEPQTNFIEAELEVIEPQTDFIEAEPEVIEPQTDFLDVEPEVIEPQTDFLDVEPEVNEAEPEVIEPQTDFLDVEPEVIEPQTDFLDVEPEVNEAEPEVIEAEPEVIEPEFIEPPTDFIDVEPEVIEPPTDFIHVQPEVTDTQTNIIDIEPAVIEPETMPASLVEPPSYDNVPLIDYFRDLRTADRADVEVAPLEVEESVTEPEVIGPESIDDDGLGTDVATPAIELDSLGYAVDLGYDVESDAKELLTTKPDEPAWEELSIEDLHTLGSRANETVSSPSAASADTRRLDAESPATSETSRQPGGRRKAPAKPWHRLGSGKVASAAPRRARQVTPIDEVEETEPVVEPLASPAEPAAVKAFGFVEPTTPPVPYEPTEPIIDIALPQPIDTEIDADRRVGLHAAIASHDHGSDGHASDEHASPEQFEPEPVGWSIDRRTDDPWTPAPAIAPRPVGPSFASTSAASAWDTGLSVAVSRWKTARLGPSTKSIATPPPAEVELDDEAESADAPRSRKQNVPAAPTAPATASMPEGLSRRGQKMWAAMNGGDGATHVTVEVDDSSKPRGRTVRQLLVTAVIAGTLLMSSLHYTEISKWVSDHVDLPGIGESQDDPHQGGKNEPDTKGTKPDADKHDPKGQPAGNN